MTPGFYTSDQLSNPDYHAGPGVSNSGLKLIGERTPAHFRAEYLAPRPEKLRARAPHAMFIGTAIHAAALEPDRFEAEYVVAEQFGKRNDAGYKAWSQQQRRNILLPDEYRNVIGMRAALHEHKTAAALLEDAYEFEYSAYALDPTTGVLVRIRMDLLTSSGWIVDLKKCEDASPESAARSIASYGYYHQDAFYSDVLEWASGEAPAGFAFVFIEEQPPHAVGVYVLEGEDRVRGRELYRRNLNRYARCLQRNEWPAYSQDAEYIALPRFKRTQLDTLKIEGI